MPRRAPAGWPERRRSNDGKSELAQQLTKDERKDASVSIVVDLDGRIDAKLDRLLNDRTILARYPQGNVLARSDIVGHPEDIGNLPYRPDQGSEP